MTGRVFTTSIAVCTFVGIPIGTLAFAIINGSPSLIVAVDLAGVPILIYGFIVGLPVAFVAGLVGGAVELALLRWKLWNPAWPVWVLACATLGLFTAAVLAVVLSRRGWQDGAGAWGLFGLFGPSSAVCGAMLGHYGWGEKRQSSAASELA